MPHLNRSWHEAVAKLNAEGRCRVCKSSDTLEAAHTIGRAKQDVQTSKTKLLVKAECIVPLCRPDHQAYDAHRLDLLPFLDLWEQLAAVEAADGIEPARNRLRGRKDEDHANELAYQFLAGLLQSMGPLEVQLGNGEFALWWDEKYSSIQWRRNSLVGRKESGHRHPVGDE